MENADVKEPTLSLTNANAKLTPDLRERVFAELKTMINFSTQNGKKIPATIDLQMPGDDKELISNYNILSAAIAPATIQSIKYIDSQILNNKTVHWYKVPIFTKCLVIAICALISLITISLLPSVNEANQAKGLLSSQGMTLFYNLVFICSASLLGVMFYLLKTISDKIKDYSLRPVDAIEVNATIIIGVISGFIISELFTFQESSFSSSIVMQKMTLALLGGFSSDAIFTVLQGIVNKLKMLFSTPS